MSIQEFPNTSAGRSSADSVPDPKHVWFDGSKVIVFTGGDAPTLDPRPTVTKWQLVQACADAGITEAQIDAAVLLITPKRQRLWKFSGVFDRDNPFAGALRTNLTPVPTPAQWNAIFLAAASLDPLVV